MKKVKLDCTPKHSHLPKTVNVKVIISSRNENEASCKIIKVTDIMLLHTEITLLKLHNGKKEKLILLCWQWVVSVVTPVKVV